MWLPFGSVADYCNHLVISFLCYLWYLKLLNPLKSVYIMHLHTHLWWYLLCSFLIVSVLYAPLYTHSLPWLWELCEEILPVILKYFKFKINKNTILHRLVVKVFPLLLLRLMKHHTSLLLPCGYRKYSMMHHNNLCRCKIH